MLLSGAPSRWFGLCVLLLSLLAHWITLEWAQGNLSLPGISSMAAKPEQVLDIVLQTAALPDRLKPPPSARQAVVPTKPAGAADKAKAVAPPPTAAPASDTSGVDTASVANDPASVASDPAPLASDLASLAPVQESRQQSVPEAPSAPTDSELVQGLPPLFERAVTPPSADLSYTVRAQRSGSTTEGNGKIFWRAGQSHYSITGEAGILFFTLLRYQSTGSLSQQGIAPELYTEKRFRKPATNTHFHRERQVISFSASAATYPRKGDEQDRASVIWQLASLGRGDGAKLVPGLTFELPIAGSRSVSSWRIYVNGKQTIHVGGSSTEAWHLSLLPAEHSYEQQLELWLAPQKEWYPVKLLYTDVKGGHLEMLLSKIETSNVSNTEDADKKNTFSSD